MGKPGTVPQHATLTLGVDEDGKKPTLALADVACRVKAVKMVTEATVNKADTNYTTFVVKVGTKTVATIANGPVSGGQTFTANTPVSLTVTEQDVEAGGTVHLEPTDTGDGLAMGRTHFYVELGPNASAVG